MRPDPRDEAERWIEQGRRDLAAARYLVEGGHHNVACDAIGGQPRPA